MKTSLHSCSTIRSFAAALGLLIVLGHHSAQAQTWNGGGANDNWTTGANWGGTAPVAGNALTFGGTTRLGPVNDFAANTSFAGLTFASGAGAFTLSGNRITLGGNVTNSSSSLQTLNLDMILGATRTFSTTSGSMAVGGIISSSGAFGILKNQANTLTLTGANTYTGTTTVEGGILAVSGLAGTIKDSSSVTVSVGSNISGQTSAVLRLDNTAGNVDRIGNARSVNLVNQGELALIGNTTTSTTENIGALNIGTGTRSSSGTITLSGTAGGLLTTLTASSFARVNNSTALIRGTSLGQTATNATRLTLGSTTGLSFVGTTTANGSTPGTAKDVKIVPYLLGDTSATGNGSGFVTYDTIGGLRPLGASEYTTLTAGYTAPTSRENVIAFNGTITAANPTVNSLLFSTASQTLNGSGALTVESGALAAVANSASIGSGFSSITFGNGTWNEGVITASSGNTFTINAPLAVTGGAAGVVTKAGAGTVALTAASSHDATTYVTQGSLRALHDRALGSTVGGTIVNGQAGARLFLGNSTTNVSLAESLTFVGEGPSFASALSVDGGQQTLTGAISTPGSTRINVTNGSLTIAGGVTGSNVQWTDNATTNGTLLIKTTAFNLGTSGTYYKDSVGLTVLNVAGNTWGTTTLASTGTLRLGIAGALPSTSLMQLGVGYATPANLDLNGYAQTVNGLRNNTTAGIASTRVIWSANAATLTLNSSTDYGFDGSFFGALGLIKNGTNTQTLSGTSLHTGDTVVNAGTLAVANTGLLANSTLDTGSSGAQQVTFTFAGTNTYSLGGLKGADALAIGANSLNIGLNNQSTSFTGAITGTTGGLTKVGTGALTFGGDNSYTGATVVNSGTLILDYTASINSKLSDLAALTLGSATLQLDRSASATGTHTEVVLSTAINGGAAVTRGTGSTAVLQMNALTRSAGGSLNLGAASIASTDTNNTNGILGPWATINGTDWASSVDSGAADTLITAYAAYTDVQRLTPGTIADGSTTNVRLIEGSGSAGNIALGAATTTINTLNQSTSGGTSAAIIDAAGKTLAVNGILVGSGAGALTIGTAVGSGTLQAATAGGELVINHYGSNLTINSVIANNTSASGLTQSGTGTTVLAGTNTFNGKTIINGGKLSIAAETGLGSNPGTSTADHLTLNGGTLLTTATLAIDDTNRGITLGAAGGTFEVSTGTTTIAATSVIAGSGGLTKTGAGQLTLSGTANTYTGPTTISAGILSVSSLGNGGANSALGASNRANFNLIFDGGTLQYTSASSSTSDRFFNINDGKTATIEVQAATFGNTPTLTLGGGAGATTGALTKTGLGTLSLIGGSDYSGATTVSAGTLLIGADYALGSTLGSTTVASGAMLQFQNSITVAEAISITGNGTGNSGSLRSDSGANTLTGLLTLASGTSRIRADGGALTLSGGVTGPNSTFQVIVNGTGVITFNTNPINVGTGRVELVGATGSQSRLAIGGNTYSVLQVAWDSRTRLDVANALSASGVLEIGSAGTGTGTATTGVLDLYGNNQTIAELRTGAASLGQAGTRTIGSVTPATLTVNQSTNSTYDGTLTGALALTKSGNGTLTLTGANTYSGTTTVSGGNLELSSAGALADTSAVNITGSSATFQISAISASGETVGSIAGVSGSSVILGAKNLNAGGDNTSTTFAGVVSGSGGSITKTGAGSFTLSGANTYTGTTTVSAGSLQVGSNGVGQTGTGAVTVQSGSTILGTGVVRGSSLTADSGSTLHAGDSTANSSFGTLNFTPATGSGTHSLQGSIVLGIGTANNLGSIDATFGGNDVGTAGYLTYVNNVSRSQGLGAGSHDLLSFNAAVNAGDYTLNFLNTSGSLEVVAGTGFDNTVSGQIFNLLDWFGITGGNTPTFGTVGSNYRSGGTGGGFLDLPSLSGGLLWDVSQFTTSGIVVVVPEPSRALLLMLGLFGWILRRRR